MVRDGVVVVGVAFTMLFVNKSEGSNKNNIKIEKAKGAADTTTNLFFINNINEFTY